MQNIINITIVYCAQCKLRIQYVCAVGGKGEGIFVKHQRNYKAFTIPTLCKSTKVNAKLNDVLQVLC